MPCHLINRMTEKAGHLRLNYVDLLKIFIAYAKFNSWRNRYAHNEKCWIVFLLQFHLNCVLFLMNEGELIKTTLQARTRALNCEIKMNNNKKRNDEVITIILSWIIVGIIDSRAKQNSKCRKKITKMPTIITARDNKNNENKKKQRSSPFFAGCVEPLTIQIAADDE